MLRTLGALYLAGALLELVSTVFARSAGADDAGLFGVFVIAVGVGGACWFAAGRLSARLAAPAVGLGSLLVAVAIFWSHDGASPLAFIYLWVGIYSAYFFSRMQSAGQLVLAGLTYALVLAARGAGSNPAVRWLISMSTVVVAATLTRLLRDRVERLLGSLSREGRRLAEAQAVARVGSWDWDISSGRLDWSDELWRIYGLAPGSIELDLVELRDRDHPDDRERIQASVDTAVAQGRPFSFERRIRRPDGTVRFLHAQGEVVTDEDGRTIGMRGTVQDITRRTHREAALRREASLREADERFRTAFDQAPIGVCLISLGQTDAGRLVQVNPAFGRILGRSVADLTGVAIGTLTHDEDRAGLDAVLGEMADGRREHVELERRFVHRDGHLVWVLVIATLLSDAGGPPSVAVTHVMDISDRKQFDDRLQHLADHDALTGLYNRRRFTEELEQALKQARRFAEYGAVLFLDLDGFKFVNDSFGHAAGDEMIIRVARLLRATVRETDTLARVGGDEFAVLLPRCDGDAARVVAEKLLAAVRRHGVAISENRQAQISTSIGIAEFDGKDDLTADEIVVEADVAMYDAKDGGKDQFVFYKRSTGRREQMSVDHNWNQRLRNALEDDLFVLHAQPIVPIASVGAPAFELLLRLPNASGDLVHPGSFLANAERFGLIDRIDHWVLREAVRHLSRSHAAGNDLMLTVNVSGKTMGNPNLGGYVESLLADNPIQPDRLVIEITETAAIINIQSAHHLADELRALGCKLALDDFGAGFASFYYLKHLDFDFLKIDGEFIRNLCTTATDQLVVRAVVTVADGLETSTIAEFVGDDATLQLLRDLGVSYGQGYHLGRPAALGETLPYLIGAPASGEAGDARQHRI
jgi:diguanylate cyclase (GGDEF)-like protein/PAS domain S-box-containing protein